MGIIRKEAFANSIFSYIGVILGYINVIILFPAFFSSSEFGLLSLIISVSAIYANLSAIGLVTAIPRFFPFFKTDDKKHEGFLAYILLIATTGFLLATILLIILRPVIIEAYIEKSPEFVEYYFFLIPLSLFTLQFNVFEATARAIYKTAFATFLRETFLRLLTTVGILLFMLKYLNYHQFIYYYVFISGICAVLLLLQIILSKEFSFKINFRDVKKEKLFEIFKYGGFLYISSVSMLIGQSGADTIILGSMVGLSIVGAYTVYMRIASLIYVPMRSLSRISVAIIATSWKENDIKQISDIYKRTSLIQLIFGCLIYLGVIINKHNLFYFLKKPEYIESFDIFYFVGLAVLIDIAVGLNTEIIATSAKYKYDALFNMILLTVSITANYFLIPIYGGLGAAYAAIISFFIFNFLKWLFLVINYNMQPLDYKQIIVIITAVLTYLIGNLIPIISNVFIDAILRSSVVIIIYSVILLLLKVSPDLNERYIVYKNYLLRRNK